MKHFTKLTVLTALFFACACSDIELNEPVEVTNYFKLYGGFHNDHVNAITPALDSGLYIAGYAVTETDISMAYIAKTYSSGMIDWDTTLTGYSSSVAHDIFASKNGTTIAACSHQFIEDSASLSLLKFDATGNISDSLSTKINANKVKNVQIIYQEGGPLSMLSQIAIIADDENETETDILIIHQLTEELVFEEVFYVKLNQPLIDKIIVQYNTPESVYIATTVYESSSLSTDVRILHMINNTLDWDRVFGVMGESESCSDMLIYNNKLVIAGNHRATTDDLQKINLLTIDLWGNEESNISISADNYAANISCASFTSNDSNNFVFCGNLNTGKGKDDILFLETTSNGTNVNSYTYGSMGESPGSNIGRFITFLNNSNKYLITGEFETFNNYDIGVLKVNYKGEILTE